MENQHGQRPINLFWFAGFVLLFSYYIFASSLDVIKNNFCGNTGIDYCAYWSTGQIINKEGFSKIYDVAVLKEYQSPIYPRPFKNNDFFLIIPFPYLPIFAIPFAILSQLGLKVSYLIWVMINIFAFVMYFQFFIKETLGRPLEPILLVLLLFSVPVFLNLSYGQLNIWLGIFAGEFVRNIIKKRPIQAGLWLAGLLLKPQTLVLVLPYLLLTKNFRALLGFMLNSALLGTISAVIAGREGIVGLTNILLGSSSGRSASNPYLMMNWRMLSMHINNFTGTTLGTSILILGVIFTLIFLYLILRNIDQDSVPKIMLSYFSIFIASMLVTWHAHFSQVIVALPMLTYFFSSKMASSRLLKFWIIFPALISAAIFFLPVITSALGTASFQVNFLKFLGGIRGFSLNVILLVWGYYFSQQLKSDEAKVVGS